MNDADFRKILEYMRLSWSGYRRVRKGVKRRVSHRMMEIGVMNVAQYIRHLQTDPSEKKVAEKLLSVSISRFFRDRRMWEALEGLIPQPGWQETECIRGWCAGCASGEEVYSLKILWEQLRPAVSLPPLNLIATDVNGSLLERARQGIYTPSSLKELDEPLKERFFTKQDGQFIIRQDLKRSIHWMVHNFTVDPPPIGHCHLIFIRNNLLTYYDHTIVTPAMTGIVEALLNGGLLIVGNNEQLPAGDFPIERTEAYRAILRKAF